MIEKQFESLQNIIDRCTKHDYGVVKEAFSMKKAYLNGEQRTDYIRREIFRITEKLVSISQQTPAIKSFAFNWRTPDFIWETSFYENLTIAERRKYIAFPYENFEDRLYLENPTSYNELLPYFSAIIEMLVYSNYLEDLQKTEKELLQPLPIMVEKPAEEPQEETPPIKIVGKNNPFNSQLNGNQIILLTDCVNEAHIFTTQITSQILEDLFYCKLSGDLRSANNRLLAYFMVELNIDKFITNEWQSVIANNRLILAPTKDRYLNRSDLSTATENIKFKPPIGSEIIDKYIKQLKKG